MWTVSTTTGCTTRSSLETETRVVVDRHPSGRAPVFDACVESGEGRSPSHPSVIFRRGSRGDPGRDRGGCGVVKSLVVKPFCQKGFIENFFFTLFYISLCFGCNLSLSLSVKRIHPYRAPGGARRATQSPR